MARRPKRLSSPGASSSVPRTRRSRHSLFFAGLPDYVDSGDCTCVCEFCGAYFWYVERALKLSTPAHPKYYHCCRDGDVVLPYPSRFHPEFLDLYQNATFLKDIIAYNSMFSMTSFGANIDKSVNDNRGPYVFKIGQICHRIGSLSPDPTKGPRFLQLYLFDTENEVQNRLRAFGGPTGTDLDPNIVQYLVTFLGANNEYVKTFKTAKTMVEENNLENYSVRLFNNVVDRRYEFPSPGSLGCIVTGDDTTSMTYDIVVFSHSGRPQRISKLHPSYMPLQYPLLFPYGEEGWSPRLKMRNQRGVSAKSLTVNMYYAYHIHARHQIWSPIVNATRLFQQYLVDAYTCIEEGRLDYITKHQSNLRSDYVSGLYDALSKGDREARVVGKRVFLPASFTGGPRFMYSHYQDALTICRVYGNPQYFITFTCNVKWPEITRYMDTHSQRDVHSRADIIARMFHVKVHEFIDFLKKDKTFGDVDAYLYTIEFQKRGLAHCHTLLWVKAADRIKNASDVDMYITAEMPDPTTDPTLYQTITSCMIHGPCGPLNPKAQCMKDGKCSKGYPKPFLHATLFETEGYVRYKRNPNSHHMTLSGQVIDNGYVVPYNRRLSSRFQAHINVEYCGWNMMIKYLFKYISKGADRVRYAIQKAESPRASASVTVDSHHNTHGGSAVTPVNEVQNFLDGRYICPHEAAWRILNFHIHHRYPPVQILSVHEQNMQQLLFKEDSTIPQVLSNPFSSVTTLLGWFRNNRRDPSGHELTYLEYPKSYKWDKSSKSWEPRVDDSSKVLGRLVFVHPTSGELFYLRMLLCHQKGCTSFKDLRTVSGTIYPTYRAACNALKLIGDDTEWLSAFTEASIWVTSAQLRSLFCQLLLFCEVSSPQLLWECACDKMKDDYLYSIKREMPDRGLNSVADIVHQQLLSDLDHTLRSSVPPKSMAAFGLPVPSNDIHGIL
ncbi:unnamed protein product [Lactuca saligna]|uniref:Helitron helicase-like domain-containing protein n=1 Tax=Lactuca saligna TaxID=75948 RepID=A0AA36EBL8_LACSI|nr:unnamed protein product [Lactuca saligna]